MDTFVIIPTYNEKENIEEIISLIFLYMPNVRILVVDDNSPDGTREIVKQLPYFGEKIFILQREKKEGLGKAYIHSFKHLIQNFNPEVFIMIDADMSHPVSVLPMMYDRLSHFDVIVGSRYVLGGDTIGWEFWRRALSKYANLYAKFITKISVNDLTAGFYVYKTDFLKKIDLDSIYSSGYAFQIELKNLLKKAGAKFLEYPIVFKNRTGGESKISNHIIKEGVIAPWKIRFAKNKPKILCLNCGKDTFFWGRKNNNDLFKCRECSIIFVYPIPQSIEVYKDDYFSGAKNGFGYTDYDSDKEPMIPVFEKYLDLIDVFFMKDFREKHILDIGSATGFFLGLAKKRGYKTLGIEYSPFAVSKAEEKGIETLTGDLLDISNKSKLLNTSFDVISMLDVLEHFKDPFSELQMSKNLLKKGGLMVINTPNGESFLSKILKTKWHLVVPPEHLFYFSPKNLKDYLEKNEFDILYSSNIGKSFTFSYIFKTLYKWLNISFLNYLSIFFSKPKFKKFKIPINLYDNFFMIARKR